LRDRLGRARTHFEPPGSRWRVFADRPIFLPPAKRTRHPDNESPDLHWIRPWKQPWPV
jgi:hypothetical protein